jgi:PAS domain S-box-containing protein
MKKIIEFGISPTTPNNIAERVRLANKICLLLLFTNIGYIYLGFKTANELLYFIVLAYVFILSTLIFNYFKQINFGRFLLSIYPSVVCGLAGAILSSASAPVSYATFALVVSGCIFPFIMFSYSEKKYIFLSFLICCSMVLGFNTLNSYFEFDSIPYAAFLSNELNFFTVVICLVVIFFCLNFLLNAEKKIASDNFSLVNDFNEKNMAFEKSEADLKNYIEQFKEAKIFEEQINWQNVGITKLAEVIRENNGKEEIFKNVLNFIARYTNSLKGLLYIYSHGKNILLYGAGYGVPRKEGVNHNLHLGEGLAGQCLKEKDIIHLTEIPEDFVKIDSGLGDAIPKTVMLLPIKNDNSIEGVLELAFFNELKPHEIEFLKKVSEILSTVIFNEKNNRRSTKMMEQLHASNSEIKAQEEELRQNLEELHATQEEMIRAQKETELKEAYLNALINNTTDSIIELDTNYKVLVINDTVLNRYKGTAYEGIKVGVNPLDYFPSEMREEWKERYDRGLSGEQYKFTMPSTVAGENYIRHYNINPVKDKEGKIIGVSVFSRDVKEMTS